MNDGSILARLTDAEKRAVAIRVTGSPDGLAKVKPPRGWRPAPALPAGPAPSMRLASGFTPDLLADTLRVSGCVPGGGAFAGAEIVYREDGRPREIRAVPTGLSPECQAAAVSLLVMARPRAERPPDPVSPQMLLLNLDRDAVACADEPPSSRRPRAPGSSAKLKEPRKVRNVNPVYPSDAVAAHVTGVVILEAVISTSGCVRSAEVLTTPDPRLAWSALRAVTHWTYTPTLLDGTPVPVVMTVTVNYRN